MLQVGDGPRVRAAEEALVNPADGLPLSVSPLATSGAGGAGAGATATPLDELSLEELAVNLVSAIQNSDWLEKNPPTGESIFPKAGQE